MENQNEAQPGGMLAEVAAYRQEVREQASVNSKKSTAKEEEGEQSEVGGVGSLPSGHSPVTTAAVAAPNEEAAKPAPAAVPEEKEIEIGDKIFKSAEEAIAYAESLESERLVNEAYNQGIRDSLQSVAPAAPTPEPEDDFDTKFYSDPKGTLKEIKEQAKREALEVIQKQNQAEKLWGQFLDSHPDIERRDAERILHENWEILGKMTDHKKAMDILAQKTREEYKRIADRFLPRKELPRASAQAVSTGNQSPSRVTQAAKEEKPLTMAEQMKMLRRQG